MATIEVSEDGSALTVLVPMSVRSRGGCKLVKSPLGEQQQWMSVSRIDGTLVKAVVRAFKWRNQLENGARCSIRDIAAAEKISSSYVARLLNLSLLAPDLV